LCRLRDTTDYLRKTYLPKINARFAKPPLKPEDAHVPLLSGQDLRNVFCRDERRVVSRDYVIQFEHHLYQISRETLPRPQPGERVTMRVWFDGPVHVYWKERPLPVRELTRERKEEPLAYCSA